MTDATFVVNAKDFQQALEKALRAAPKKTRLPVLGEALVTFDGDICTLTCTNLEQWCQVYVPAVGEPCSFVLNGSRKLLTACKYFSGDLELSYLEDRPEEGKPRRVNPDGTLTLRCNGKELRQRVTTAEDFPAIPKEEVSSDSYRVDSAALYERFERIKYPLSENQSRPVYQCVKFFDERIGAVDGYRLATSRDESLQVSKPFYVPPGAMKLLPIFDGIFCTLTVGTQYAIFENSASRVITRMPEGEGLDFDRAIPKTCGEEHTIDIADFVGSLRYLREFARDPSRDVIRFENGVLLMSNVNGDYSARLELDKIPRTVIGFNGSYMLDGLKQFQAKKLKTLTMQMTSPMSPIVLKDDTDLAMVLPCRLRNTANAA